MSNIEQKDRYYAKPWAPTIAGAVGGFIAWGPVGAVAGAAGGLAAWYAVERTIWPDPLRKIQRFIRNESQIYPPEDVENS